tara:strand:- start:7446 stop:9209 length:1764 start_codon:yes stop_codon:yes gene_type:complete
MVKTYKNGWRALGVASLALAGASRAVARTPQDGDGATQSPPQTQVADDVLECRVISVTPGVSLEVDRGERDRIEVGDPVLLRPRDGATMHGRVLRVLERSAIVELIDPRAVVSTGTRGEVRVPGDRARVVDPNPRTVPAPGSGAAAVDPDATPVPDHEPWTNPDLDWMPDMALLSDVGVGRPEQRERRVQGRIYMFSDSLRSTDGGRDDRFTRLGTDLEWSNPFGRGGRLQLDGEFNDSSIHSFTNDDESDRKLRVDRASYAWGGTRFDPRRYEFGRFLQHGMPEFGLVDGAEITQRREDGLRYGASLGRMPEPTGDQDATDDFQAAAWLGWSKDESERTAARVGYQKTFHNGNSDRDLFVIQAHHLPRDGWSTQGTAWIDVYQGRDVNKTRDVEVTQALLHTSRRWRNQGLDVSFRQLRFPDLLRNEFPAAGNEPIFDDHTERLSASGWRNVSNGRRARLIVGAWQDQDDSGADAELSLQHSDIWLEGGDAYTSLYASRGKFSTATGIRVGLGRSSDGGRWDVFYDVSIRQLKGFDAANDDLVQHRLRGSRSMYTAGGWNLSVYGQGLLQDHADTLSLGFFLQRSF